MRSEVYFLPPRTSVTDSVGISTLPILSCNPNACTRDSSDSFTLRSNPEYAWMMYHFIFGFFGGSAAASAPAGCVSSPVAVPAALWFFSSSCIVNDFFRSPLLAREIMEQAVETAADRQIHDPEIKGKQEHCDDDNGRRGLHFFAGRRTDLPHLRAHIVVKTLDALWPGPQRGRDRVLFYCCRHTLPAFLDCFPVQSGRGGGIRTPKFGFGDRQFNR